MIRHSIFTTLLTQWYAVSPYIDDIIGVQNAIDAQKVFDTLKALVETLTYQIQQEVNFPGKAGYLHGHHG